jgi:hypothetical protein
LVDNSVSQVLLLFYSFFSVPCSTANFQTTRATSSERELVVWFYLLVYSNTRTL